MSRSFRHAFSAAALCLLAATTFGLSAPANAEPRDADPANNGKLLAIVAPGLTECVVSKLYDAAIARVGCSKSPPGGPTAVIYSLYANADDMNKAFDSLTRSSDPVPCLGSIDSAPTAWNGGMVWCGTFRGPSQGAPTVVWTRTADLVVASAGGRDPVELYGWWLTAA
jgi:hypothetical protein